MKKPPDPAPKVVTYKSEERIGLLGDLVQTVGRGDRRDRGGRYEGVVRCGGRGGRGEVGEVPESEGIGRRGGGGGGRRGGGEQGRRRKYAAKMTTRGKEG